jgi:hypothetical protein
VIHANTASPTADYKMLVVKTGTTPTEKFSVDEDGDVLGGNYAFTSDADTGIVNAAADAIALHTAGSERVRVDSNGNVGIDTTSPDAQLAIGGPFAAQAHLFLGGGTAVNLKNSIGEHKLIIHNNTAGIELHVKDDTDSTVKKRAAITGDYDGLQVYGTGDDGMRIEGDGGVALRIIGNKADFLGAGLSASRIRGPQDKSRRTGRMRIPRCLWCAGTGTSGSVIRRRAIPWTLRERPG